MKDEKGIEYIEFFWFDAFEIPSSRPGTIYLFGKIESSKNKYSSCCVQVNNIQRDLYLLPNLKEDGTRYSMNEVKEDFEKRIKPLFPTGQFQIKTRVVKKKYAFELPDIPYEETEYLNVQYNSKYPVVDPNFKTDKILKVFGTTTSCTENLILGCNLKGPGWLKITKPQNVPSSFSYCKFEASIDSMRNITTIINKESPPLTVASLSMKTCVNNDNKSEIVLMNLMLHDNVDCDSSTPNKKASRSFSMIRPLAGKYFPFQDKKTEFKICRTETEMLNYFLCLIARYDPDILMGHNITGFELDVLLQRMKLNKVSQLSRIGRLRRTVWPNSSKDSTGRDRFYGQTTCGRILLDTYLASKELIRDTNYTLLSLSKSMLDIKQYHIDPSYLEDIDPMDIPSYYSTEKHLETLIKHTEIHSFLTLQIMFALEVVSLTKQITNIAGNLWSSTLKGNRSGRIEYLLLHKFYKLGYILPDKETRKEKIETVRNSNRKPAYSGGLVLEPRKGLYDTYILVLDFNSLYPSIIQEYNICYTTVERPRVIDKHKEIDDNYLPEIPKRIVNDDEMAPLPSVIKYLVERRREVKKEMKKAKDHLLQSQLNVKQLAFKILANSMYGCLGFSASRFYAKPIASLVTSKGRDTLQQTISVAENQGYEVIYGDTDSIMINSKSKDYLTYLFNIILYSALRIGESLKAEINKKHRKLQVDV